MLVLVWVLLIAPQRRRQQQQKRMLEELHPGDEILTAGGLYATVVEVGEERLTVELGPGLRVTLDRRAVGQRLTEDEPEEELDEVGGEDAEPSALAEEPAQPVEAGVTRPAEGPEEHPAAPRT